jgi:nucleotide-binding universal stress UspA family protein
MYRTILVPLDGSSFGERALPMATALARTTGARLVLVRAAWATVTPGMDPTEPQVRAVEECRTYLAGVAQWLADAGFDADIAVPYGQPADGILLEIELRHADLVVMGTHGRSGLGRWIYGSVAEAVLAHSPIPIVFVRPTGRLDALPPVLDHPHLLVPLDGSPFAEAALPHATALARVFDGSLHLMRVITPPPSVPTLLVVSAPQPLAAQPVMQEAVQDEQAQAENYLAAISSRLAQEGLRVQTVARFGLPAEAILEEARALGAGLIIMATHGRTGLGRLLLGSVALEVLQRDVVPLLLVRPKDLPRPGSEQPTGHE